jgi:hypothetical protein
MEGGAQVFQFSKKFQPVDGGGAHVFRKKFVLKSYILSKKGANLLKKCVFKAKNLKKYDFC